MQTIKNYIMKSKYKKLLTIFLLNVFLFSCAVMESTYKSPEELMPQQAKPEARETAMRKPLAVLGEMTKVYSTKKLYIQCEKAGDETGASIASGAEIPIDITEMIKTAVNSIGGNVYYVPYNPNYLVGQARTGYVQPKGKITPNLLMSGGITEFDRSLVSTDRKLDLSLPGTDVSGGLGGGKGDTLSQITLDINLIDYDMMTMIPKMQAINTVMVSRGKREGGIGFQIFGAALGYTSGVKIVQGRHAAVRALVELSVLEVIGRYLNLPYWKLIPEAKADAVVVDNLKNSFNKTDKKGQIITIQKLLTLYGYDIEQNGTFDAKTEQAMRDFRSKYLNLQDSKIDEDSFIALYVNVSIGKSDHEISTVSESKQ